MTDNEAYKVLTKINTMLLKLDKKQCDCNDGFTCSMWHNEELQYICKQINEMKEKYK